MASLISEYGFFQVTFSATGCEPSSFQYTHKQTCHESTPSTPQQSLQHGKHTTLIHPSLNSLITPLTYSHTHSFAHSLTHAMSRLPPHHNHLYSMVVTPTLIHPLTDLTCSHTHSFICTLTHSTMFSFTHLSL